LKSRNFKKENDLIRSELETTRHELLNMSQQVNQTIKFSEIISHEYRTPVSVISANIDILEIINAKSSLGLTKYLTKMRASIEKLIAIVETSKVKESLAANKLVAHKKPFEFNPLLYLVLADVQLVYKKHRIDVVGHDEEITLNGDIDLIGLLLKNILENACKYSPVNEPIVIKVDVDHQHLILTIRDKGIGIPENDIDSIFEKYHRAGNTSNTPGIGVGLYLSKQVAMQHQGDIHVTSTTIDGTEVTVLFPLGKHP
jgi:signal transduction histidine kinase